MHVLRHVQDTFATRLAQLTEEHDRQQRGKQQQAATKAQGGSGMGLLGSWFGQAPAVSNSAPAATPGVWEEINSSQHCLDARCW